MSNVETKLCEYGFQYTIINKIPIITYKDNDKFRRDLVYSLAIPGIRGIIGFIKREQTTDTMYIYNLRVQHTSRYHANRYIYW